MSHQCAVDSCKKVSRALCHCCNQNLCRDHLNQHDDTLNFELHPLIDQINALGDRLSRIDVESMNNLTRQRLEKWRTDSHRTIDEYCETKYREFQQHITEKISTQRNEVNRMREKINELVLHQETTREDITSLTIAIRLVLRKLTEFEHKSIEIDIRPFVLEHHFVRLGSDKIYRPFNLSTPPTPVQRPAESSKPLACNDSYLLAQLDQNLCLFDRQMNAVKENFWTHGWIWDMCWSSTLSRFIIITLNGVFQLDEDTMSFEEVEIASKHSWCSCTCSDRYLYLTTNECGSSICEFNLVPAIELRNQWQPSDICTSDEMIQDIVYNEGTLALMINNQLGKNKRMELRLSATFDRIWSLEFDIIDLQNNAFRCCLLSQSEWLVIDWKSSRVFHVTKDGELKAEFTYEPVPYRACQFGPGLLAVSTRTCVNFHQY